MSLGTNLRENLEHKNATQAELAEYCAVSQCMISKIARDIMTPSVPLLVRIASFFGCSVDELLRPHGSENEERK